MKRAITLSLLILGIIPSIVRAELPGYLVHAFQNVRWVAYSPTGPSPAPNSTSEMEKDLEALRNSGFGGIVTYGCDGLKREIPKLARKVGVEHVILGVFDPTNDEEFRNAKALAHWVDGYCVGNEGIGAENRYTLELLRERIKELKRWSGKPVSTSEQIEDYMKIPDLAEVGDWLFPNIHPFWNGKYREPEASRWTKEQFDKLRQKYSGKFIICKEVGLPTDCLDKEVTGLSEQAQADYYLALKALDVPFVYFEAFDQVWKRSKPVEPFWGLFKSDRSPKRVVALITTTRPAKGVWFTNMRDGGRIKVKLAADGPGFFEAHGESAGVAADNRELLFFVSTGDVTAMGWFLQLPPSGVDLASNGTWTGTGQIGNKLYPPRRDQKIGLMVIAAPKDDAGKVIEDRKRNPDTGILSQDLPKVEDHWMSRVREIELDIQAPEQKSQ